MSRKQIVMLALAAGLVGCGDDPQGPAPIQPEYELSVTGALTETATGPAHFGTDVDENGQSVWALLMGEDTARHLVMLVKGGSERPATGTLEIESPLVEDGWHLLHFVSDGEELVDMFVADSGQVTLSRSSKDEVAGTVEFWASGMLGGEEISVTGSFTATPAPELSASAMTAARTGGR